MKQLFFLLLVPFSVSGMEILVAPPVLPEDTHSPQTVEQLQALIKNKVFESLMKLCKPNTILGKLLKDKDNEYIMAFITWLLHHSVALKKRLSGPLSFLNGLFLYTITQQDLDTLCLMLSTVPGCEDYFVDPDDTWLAPAIELLLQEHIQAHKAHKSPGLTELFMLVLTKPTYCLEHREDFSDYVADPDTFIERYIRHTKLDTLALKCSEEQTPLIWAAMLNHTQQVQQLLKADLPILTMRDNRKLNALNHALMKKHTESIDLLIAAGASLTNKHMRYAIDKRDAKLVRILLARGAAISDNLLERALKKSSQTIIGLVFLRWKGDI